MILHFKNRAAVVSRVPKSLHVGMAVGEMLHRSAGNMPGTAAENCGHAAITRRLLAGAGGCAGEPACTRNSAAIPNRNKRPH
jgi:hypothetical protein